MDCSVEMKLQAIDKMIAMREQLATMQSNLRMDNGLHSGGEILVYLLEDLQELSKVTGSKIHETGYVTDDGWIKVALEYNGAVFNIYLSPDKYKAYKDGDESGGKND